MTVPPGPKRRASLVAAAAIGVAPWANHSVASRQTTLEHVMQSVVFVLAVDVVGDQLVPRASGSGTIVTTRGHVLTNWHILHDQKNERNHDLFVIGRSRGPSRPAELTCIGVPEDAQRTVDSDLAVIRCDSDLAGLPLSPQGWPALRKSLAGDVVHGQQVWILGYSQHGTGGLQVTAGLVSGWTGEGSGTTGRTYIKTDATIAKGASGGTAINQDGEFVGVPTAARSRVGELDGQVVSFGRVGLIRPAEQARDLIAAATEHDKVGNRELSGRVTNVNNGLGLQDAVVALLPATVTPTLVTTATLADHATAWAQTNWRGEYRLTVPEGTYRVAILAPHFVPSLSTGLWLASPSDSASVRDFQLRPTR